MKKIALLLVAALSLGLAACKDDTEGVTTRIVTPSYPGIAFNGEPVISTGVGTGTYTDAGAIGIDSVTNTRTDLQPTTNNVNLAQPGFYGVSFEARNSYGYRSNANRLVLVTQVAEADDISGVYRRTNGQEVTLRKVGRGLYLINNIGGVPQEGTAGYSPGNEAFLFPMYVGLPTENVMEVPTQVTPLGDTYCTGGQVTRTGNQITFSYIVINPAAFGTARRTFNWVRPL